MLHNVKQNICVLPNGFNSEQPGVHQQSELTPIGLLTFSSRADNILIAKLWGNILLAKKDIKIFDRH
jgi:hypothetical protein